MINTTYSSWGIKPSGHDFFPQIIKAVKDASSFVVVGGYNFSFNNDGLTFFAEIKKRAANGVPIIFLCPSGLMIRNSDQLRMINTCIANDIGVILNGKNHSKWLLTDKHLYYGSSNFTPTSWKDKVEVVTMHRFDGGPPWMKHTVADFKQFLQDEINRLSRRSTYNRYPGLRERTIQKWQTIQAQIKKLNPSVAKVRETLENYEGIVIQLEEIVEDWFYLSDQSSIEQVFQMNLDILNHLNDLCSYAYSNIVNEAIETDEINAQSVILQYNKLYEQCQQTIAVNIEQLSNYPSQQGELQVRNIKLIQAVGARLGEME